MDSYLFIEQQEYAYPISKMCRWLAVSRSGFYEWRGRPMSVTAMRRASLMVKITTVFEASDETYGYRRVTAELARKGVRAGEELVRSLMRQMGLVACQPRPWRHSLTQGGPAGPIPDLVDRDFTAAVPGAKMVGDITYIPTWQGWLYLLVTWNHMLGVQAPAGLSAGRFRRASEEAVVAHHRGGGEVARAGSVRARGRVAADVVGPGAGSSHDRCLRAGAGRVPAAVRA